MGLEDFVVGDEPAQIKVIGRVVKGNVDGDGDSDFTIIVRDLSKLGADDVIL